MKKNRILLIALGLLGAALLSGCGAAPVHAWPGLSADGEQAYVADGSYVYAVDLRNGDQVWRYPEGAQSSLIFYAAPALLPDGRVLIGSAGSDNCLHVIETGQVDQATGVAGGRCFFDGAGDHWVAAPLIADEVAYAPNNDGQLYVLDLASGGLLWSLEIGGHLWSTPVTDGEQLYISSLDHQVYAVDLEARRVAWNADLGGAVPGSPALSEDGSTLYVGSLDSQLFALDVETGAILWSEESANWVWGTPAVSGDTLYYADLDGFVYALDLASGRQNWGGVQPDAAITAGPLTAGEYVIVATESGSVFALDAQGRIAWSPAIGGKIYTPVVTSGDFVLVAPFQANSLLVALDLNGRQAWAFEPEN